VAQEIPEDAQERIETAVAEATVRREGAAGDGAEKTQERIEAQKAQPLIRPQGPPPDPS
jgi:hypothetical protein